MPFNIDMPGRSFTWDGRAGTWNWSWDVSEYAAKEIRDQLERGPYTGEDFYRLKVSGMGETKHVNVTHDELLVIAHILNPAWMHFAKRLVRDALEGDSNDAEHAALVECAHALNITYRLES